MKRGSGWPRRPALPSREEREAERQARPLPALRPLRMGRVVPVPDAAPAVLAKLALVRSEALRRAYRALPCQHCGAEDGTVCCAHSNWAVHGKGKSMKAGDDRAASLCFRCHGWLDQGPGLRAQKWAMWWPAHQRTVRELVARGLWPAGVPVPDVDHEPEGMRGLAA